MNENLNLIEILKDRPKGTKLYSTVRNYPYRIYTIDYDGYYGELPEKLECNPNDDNFVFETSWFDLDYEAYYNELKEKHINIINHTIEKVEQSLVKHREEIQRLSKSKISDIEFQKLILEED